MNASPLSYAVSDAEEIRDVLVSDLAFPTENITYLVDSEATKENILRSFMRLTADDVELDERIMIFFAGHGHTRTGIRGEVGYLVPYDADMTDFSTFKDGMNLLAMPSLYVPSTCCLLWMRAMEAWH